ncbi:hypothetical protein TNCV_1616501 [Trichonephila clavipes]|nr:hypothetical protein TNCV_1616501 [Trichonephila clavipes]
MALSGSLPQINVAVQGHFSESLLPQLIQKGFHVGDFRKIKKLDKTPYKLPPPTPVHVPAENRTLEEKSLPLSKRHHSHHETCIPSGKIPSVQIPSVQIPLVQIPHVPEPVQIPHIPEPVQIPHVPEPVQIPHVPEPVQIPHVPEPVHIPHVPELVQIPHVPQPLVQIPHVPQPIVLPVQIPPEPIPELDTLTDAASFDQRMSFVFGPPVQELQLLHTVPSIFDGDLISFLDELERELAMEPMDLTMP